MGNLPGMPAFPGGDIQRIAKEVLETFTPIYVKSYAILLVDKLRAEAEHKEAPSWQLRSPPVPSEVLKQGYGVKFGTIKWNRRYFVALNEADNFRIIYFDNEAQAVDHKKARGTIHPCGYKIKLLDLDEEKKEFGDFALMFKPNGRRTSYYIRFASAEERKSWHETFEYAARRAGPPFNPDPVMAGAFKRAYAMTRWRLGVWDWWTWDRTEEEQLGQMIVNRCEADVMGPVYAKIPGGRLERKIRGQLEKMLDQTVGAAVGTAWRAVTSAINGSKDKVEKTARDALGTLFEKQAELKAKVRDGILGIISPPLEEITKPVLGRLFGGLMLPLVAAYKELGFSLAERMSKIIADGVKPEDIRAFERDLCWYWWGPMTPAYKQIWRALRDGYVDDAPETAKVSVTLTVNLGDILDCFNGVDVWEVQNTFEDHVRKMMGKAIYTFATDLEESKGEPNAVLDQVVTKLVADSKQQAQLDIKEIFLLILKPQFKKHVDPLIKSVLEPLASLIPEPLKILLDIEKMAEEVLDEVLEGVVTNCIRTSSPPVLSLLDSLPAEVRK